MKKIQLILAFGLLFGGGLFAQQQQITPTSPTAASLQKSIDIPVSNHTGAVGFNIPIYEIKDGSLSLPISLDYHSGGIKVAELASWVGLGWSLNAGGAIMRQVKSVPDEGIASPQSRGWYRTGNILPDNMFAGYTPGGVDITKDGSFGFSIDNVWVGETASSGKFDTEPDVFSFNVKGATGKFVYDDVYERKMAETDLTKRNTIEPQTHIFPLQDIKIETKFDGPDNSYTGKFKYFKLTTPDGTKYFFGDYNPESDPNFVPAIERSRSYIQKISGYTGNDGNGVEAADWITSAWYLVRIESADGRRMIKLNYVPERSGYYDLGLQFRKLNEQGICGSDYYDAAQSSNFIKVSKVGTKSVRLASVETANLKVNFVANTLREDLNSDGEYTSNGLDANTQAKRLDAIEIRSKLSTTCRRFELNYDYFQSDGQEQLPAFYRDGAAYESDWGFADKKRLRLLSVQEMACDQSLKLPKTSFEYHKEFNFGIQEIKLPRRLSMSKDYWGYFNNQFNEDGLSKPGLIPNVLPTIQPANPNLSCNYAKREPNEQAMKVGVLEKITYPMGGSVLISYEGHHTDNPYQINSLGLAPQGTVTGRGKRDDNDYNLVGGLRVKSVKTFDNSQKVAEKRFEYSGGLVFGMPVYAINLDKVRAFNRYTPSPTSPVCDCLLGGSNGFTWKADKTPIATCTPCGGFYASSESMVPVHSTQSNYHIGYQSVSVKQVATDLNGTVIDDLGKTESFYEMSRYENYKYQSDLNLFNTSTDIISSPNTFDNRPVFAGANCGLQYPIPPVPHFYERGELSLERMYNKNGVLVSEKNLSRSTDGQKAIPLGQKYMRATQFSVGRCMRVGTSTGSGGITVTVNSGVVKDGLLVPNPKTGMYRTADLGYTNTDITINSNGSPNLVNFNQSVPYFSHYYIYLGRTKLDQVSTTVYDPNGNNPITTLEAYKYGNGSNHFQLIESKFKNSQNEYVITELRYPQDVANGTVSTANDAQSLGIKKLIEAYSIGSVIEKITKKAPVGGNTERVIASQITQYDPDHLTPNKVFNLEILAPITSGFVKANVQNGLLVKDSRIATNANQTFKYDIDGNIIETQSREGQGMTTAYLYGYNNRLPIAEVKNATYAQIVAALGPVGMAFVNNPTLANQDLEATLSALRSIPNTLVSTFTYDVLNGVLTSTGPNGLKNTYQYDGLGRLLNIRDPNNNLIKSYSYNYRNQ